MKTSGALCVSCIKIMVVKCLVRSSLFWYSSRAGISTKVLFYVRTGFPSTMCSDTRYQVIIIFLQFLMSECMHTETHSVVGLWQLLQMLSFAARVTMG